jgi:malonyl-CoA O-methyltransferase
MDNSKTINAAKVAQQFSQSAKRYDANAMLQHNVMKAAFIHAERYFSPEAEVLDIGCGTGFFARYAQEKSKNWQIDGLDIALGMCEMSRQYYRRMMMADMEALPVKPVSYDGVFSSLAIQWANHTPACWQGFADVLKPGGYAIITSFASNTLKELRLAGKAVGLENIVMPMHDCQTHHAAIENAGMVLLESDIAPKIDYVVQVSELIEHLRAIGASNAAKNARKKLSADERSAMIGEYEAQFRSERGLQVTWEPVIFVAQKPA